MKKKPVTIRDLKEAARESGYEVTVQIWKSNTKHVIWYLNAEDESEWPLLVQVQWHSRQGVMRKALAALRAK